MWNDVEEIGTPGEETKMLAINVDFTPIPRERTVRPGKSPSYKYNKKNLNISAPGAFSSIPRGCLQIIILQMLLLTVFYSGCSPGGG